ncbi:hypothetical protein SanaruYs_03260 [Chryseotalea sanaruensis]|uniref:Uncharacterized protein n=1 Tax=Chryseotalea sanaruensis TaxID=2482724 RepID=A0A401U5C1_9BACT|nr:hypothetical protein [Chryseotalea sanaruensis]GCC50111.1 hypothetical protein SanaruYs_03260 [Chryseotalea sanaruensis]
MNNILLLGIGGTEAFVMLLLGLAIIIIIFLVLRGLTLWYWKIDTIVSYQAKQIKLLQEILEVSKKQNENVNS